MKSMFLTGANRCIGLALVKEALNREYRVFAGCRQPQKAAELQALAETGEFFTWDGHKHPW